MIKTHATLEIAARDGPLLNFCKLGHLGLMAVPFKGSGLEDTDYFKKLLELLQKMTVDPRLPLKLASPLVWEDLRRLQEEVFDICAGSSDKDEANMQELLAKIDAVYQQRPSSTQEHRPNDHVQPQASGTPPVAQPNPPFRGQIPANDRSSYASSSTTVIGGRHSDSPTQEDYYKGLTLTPTSQASLRHHSITPAANLQTYIVFRTPSSRARLGPVAPSFIHCLHPSYPRCPLQWEAPRIKHPQAFQPQPFNIPYLICATVINTAVRRCTIPQGGIPGPIGRPRCRHHRRQQECFLP
ncbi:hypothetical protein H4582DRAFT_1939990, partial [Lactarius indigo]